MKKLFLFQQKFKGSKEHQKFIKKERTKTFFIHLSRVLILVLFIGLWELVAYKNWVDPFIISSPSRVVKQTIELYNNGTLFLHITTTLNETLLAFILSTIIGFVVVFILAILVLSIVVKLLDKITRLPVINLANRILGALIGVLVAVMIAWVVSIIAGLLVNYVGPLVPDIFNDSLIEDSVVLRTVKNADLMGTLKMYIN